MLKSPDDPWSSDSCLFNCVEICRPCSGHVLCLKPTSTSQPASFIHLNGPQAFQVGSRETAIKCHSPHPPACYFSKEFRTQKPFYLPFPEVWNGGTNLKELKRQGCNVAIHSYSSGFASEQAAAVKTVCAYPYIESPASALVTGSYLSS